MVTGEGGDESPLDMVSRCHRLLLKAHMYHPSKLGYELLVHPSLKAEVQRFEAESVLAPGSFATLVGVRRLIYTLGAGETFALFCLQHVHRLDSYVGAAGPEDPQDSGTIAS